MMIKGINALVDAKRASSFNNAIKLLNENVQITHNRLITLENRSAMMAKAIISVLKDFKEQINNTNDRLRAQYRMMTRAHERYNRLFRQTHKTVWRNLTVHCSVTPFVIWQPIWKPHPIERVYKPMHTSH